MTANGSYRAWRFLHPDIDASGDAAGLQVSSQGSISLVSGSAAIRQSILLLISTIPGERVKRPAYGCHLHRLLFEPNDDTTAGLAIHYVRQAIERWEPRVRILGLDAGPHPIVPTVLEITLEFQAPPSGAVEHLGVSLDLGG